MFFFKTAASPLNCIFLKFYTFQTGTWNNTGKVKNWQIWYLVTPMRYNNRFYYIGIDFHKYNTYRSKQSGTCCHKLISTFNIMYPKKRIDEEKTSRKLYLPRIVPATSSLNWDNFATFLFSSVFTQGKYSAKDMLSTNI